MSGIEIIGLISTVISIVGTIESLYSSLKDEKNLPQAFHDIAGRLPIVRDTLRIAEQNITSDAEEEACRAMYQALENCKAKADKLEEIFKVVIPSEPQSRLERYRTIARRWGKGNKVEDLARGMMEDVKTLALNHVVQAATEAQVAQLLEAIKDLSCIQPSLTDEESVVQNHYGGGDNVAGNKYQGNHNVNSGSGNAYFGPVTQHVINQVAVLRAADKAESDIDTCLRILPDVEMNSAVIEDCEPAEWFLDNDTYRNWFYSMHDGDEEAALLILKGKVGVGKSVLLKQLALDTPVIGCDKTIRIHYSFQPESVMAKGPKRMRKDYTIFHLSLLASLVNEFPTNESPAIVGLAARLRKMKVPTVRNEQDLSNSIIDIMRENRCYLNGRVRFRMFIDGLEECSAEHPHTTANHNGSLGDEALKVLEFVSKILSILIPEGIDVGICLSRGYSKDVGAYEPNGQVLELEQHISHAVQRYIIRRIKRLPRANSNDLLATILSSRLLGHSTNGFLWASVVTKQILHAKSSTTDDEYISLVERVPDKFSDFYIESLQSIAMCESREALSYLLLIAGAARSLSSEELRHAWAFSNENHHDTVEDWEKSDQKCVSASMFKDRIRQSTMGLIEVTEVHKRAPSFPPGAATNFLPQRRMNSDLVRFIHPSVTQFLYGERGIQHFFPHLSGALDAQCHFLLFNICMRVLESCNLDGTDTNGFLDYACKFWPYHARGAGALLEENNGRHLPRFMLKCLKTRRRSKLDRIIEQQMIYLKRTQAKEFILLEASQSTDESGSSIVHPEQQASMLVLLATLGCTTIILQHVKHCTRCGSSKSKDLSTIDRTSSSFSDQQLELALGNAIVCGHSDTAIVLLELQSGSDATFLSADSSPYTVLYQACYFEQLDIVALLLANGADPTERSTFAYEYPLNVAIVKGNVELIKILLHESRDDRERTLKTRRKRTGHTALHFAVTTGQRPREKLAALEAVVECAPHGLGLLDLKDSNGKTPLDLADEISEAIGSDIMEVLEGFEEDDETNTC